MALASSAAARLFPLVPRRIARGLAARYIAGASADQAIGVALRLRERGLLVTLARLGESVQTAAEAARHVDHYVGALAALHHAGLQPHISVKPSALGSLIDWHLCEQHVAALAQAADAHRGLVCLDMEWAHTIDGTLRLYRRLRDRQLDNVTLVVQTRLHRTRCDLAALAPLLPHVRICKGIYPEPAQIAYTEPEAVRRNYIFCLDTLLESGGYAAIATHDEAVIVSSLERLAYHNRTTNTYEFQMLLGVRQDLAESLAAAGHPVRIYVPYGNDWHQYAIRRFRESPQIAGYVTRGLARALATRLPLASARAMSQEKDRHSGFAATSQKTPTGSASNRHGPCIRAKTRSDKTHPYRHVVPKPQIKNEQEETLGGAAGKDEAVEAIE